MKNVDSTKEHTNEQRILSFCYGYGGLEKGISAIIPTRTIAYVEIEAFQNFNLVSAMESGLVDQAPIWTNLKTFDANPFRDRIHGIVGGYPCQGESHAGKRELWKDDRFLWPYIEKAIIATKPIWCFFENVSGHLTGSFPYILESLRSMGYAVEAGLFTADEVGSPQERKRTFILAVENSKRAKRWAATTIQSKTEWSQSTDRLIKASGTELDDSINGGLWRTERTEIENRKSGSTIRRELAPGSKRSSANELGDTERVLSQGCNRGSREMQPRGTSDELPDTSGQRRNEDNRPRKPEQLNKDVQKWPAKRGQQQYEWEAPRTIKSGVGCTVNGYNFRTELLRQYGNGVVSQTAALAFETLVNKLITDNSKIL